METIPLYEAIQQMRELTKAGKSFSFVHATYNREKRSSDGLRNVKSARLRPKSSNDDIIHSDFKLFYYDEEEQLPRVCWQPLIMFFNGKKVILT